MTLLDIWLILLLVANLLYSAHLVLTHQDKQINDIQGMSLILAVATLLVSGAITLIKFIDFASNVQLW